MRIKTSNKYVARVIAWLFRIKPYKIEFVYRDVQYDPELSYLAFLNQNKEKFSSNAEQFVNSIDEAIEHEANKTR